MIGSSSLLAKRYATAWMNIFGDQLPLHDFNALQTLALFLVHHKNKLTVYMFPSISLAQKIESLETLFCAFGLGKRLTSLVILLEKNNRLLLLPAIIEHIAHEYKKRHNLMSWTITTSHTITQDTMRSFENFLARKTGYVIISKHTIDKKLIAGVRLQSDTLLWEYSIRKQLEQAYLPLIR